MDGQSFRQRTSARSGLGVGLAALLLCGGCNLLSHVSYWSGASMVPAAHDLSGQRVAVVCLSDSASYGSQGEAAILARMVGALLRENVDEIDLVPASEIADWDDQNDWNEIDYREVGQGVKADAVVAIDLSGFRLHEGDSLYKGRAGVKITVLDMTAGGREVFSRQLPEISYPVNGFYSTTEARESAFRQAFLRVIARRAARHFFAYDAFDEFGPDPAGVSG